MEPSILWLFAAVWALGAGLTYVAFLVIRGQEPRVVWLLIPALAIGVGFAPTIWASGGHFSTPTPAIFLLVVTILEGSESG